MTLLAQLIAKLTPRRRRRIYRTLNALLGVAVVYRVLDGDQAAAWLLVVNAALGMADANVDVDE